MKWAHIIAEDNCESEGIIDDISDFPMVAHQHDEAQTEVDAEEVLTMQYEIKAEDWKAEEKRQHKDDDGIWSAPTIVDRPANEGEGFIVVERMYHPIGEQYCIALQTAGEFLGLRCPTAGEYKIGDSWAETH